VQNDLYGGGKRLQSNSSACSIDLLWTIASLSTRPKTTEHTAQSTPPLTPFFKAVDRPSITGIRTTANIQIQIKLAYDIAANLLRKI
jgi:hypothetical protein